MVAGIVAALPLIGKVIDKIFPDAKSAEEAKLELLKLTQEGNLAELDAEVQVLLAQLAVNKEEARSGHIWVAGWRPFIGWVGGAALAWNFIVYPTVTWFGVETPPLDLAQLMLLITGMLGIGWMRSHDKANGVDTQNVT